MKKLFLPAIAILLFLIFSGIFTLSAQQASQSAAAQQPSQSAAQQPSELAEQGLLFTLATELPYRAGTYREEIEARGLTPNASISLQYEQPHIGLIAAIDLTSDQVYGPWLADSPTGALGNFNFMIKEAGIRISGGSFSLKGGRLRHFDVVDSPYSLFINANGIAAPMLDFVYRDDRFFYESRYISLTLDSAMHTPAWPDDPSYTGFPDRGANFKVFGLSFGRLTIGFEDSSVYSGRAFDWEYFLSPMPQYFTQYVRGTGGRPWYANYDDNYNAGLFVTWKEPGAYDLYAQAFVDDLGMLGLFGWTNNPWQIALALGGRIKTPKGTFGLHLAGATKYTFEPGDMRTPTTANQIQSSYGYTYFPETRFEYEWRPSYPKSYKEIAPELNLIGYQYGENNLAMRLDWNGSVSKFECEAFFEFRLSGSNSPANPWHDLWVDPQVAFTWLDDSVLEKRFTISARAITGHSPWQFFAKATGSLALDALELRDPIGVSSSQTLVDQKVQIYSPVPGNTKLLGELTLGVLLRLGI